MPSSPTPVALDTIREGFACILQARLSWPQADACAADLADYLQRQGFTVVRPSDDSAPNPPGDVS